MNVREFMERTAKTLSSLYRPEETRSLALRLLEEIAGIPPYALLIDPMLEISELAFRTKEKSGKAAFLEEEIKAYRPEERLRKALERLESAEPVQYVLGYEYFCGHRFTVAPGVLIPRPETEELVRLVCRDQGVSSQQYSRLEKAAFAHALSGRGGSGCGRAVGSNEVSFFPPAAYPAFSGSILDIGTGSGCIAHSLAYIFRDASVYGCDISSVALEIARSQNIVPQPSAGCVSGADSPEAGRYVPPVFFECDILDEERAGEVIRQVVPRAPRIIISNPPYVCEKEKAAMHPNVLNFEPSPALFVPDNDPLLFYRSVVRLAARLLEPGGRLYFEINENYPGPVADLLEREKFGNIRIEADINGKFRLAAAEKPSGGL